MSQTFWTAVGAIASVAGVAVALWATTRGAAEREHRPSKDVRECPTLRIEFCDLNYETQANRVIDSCLAYIKIDANNARAYYNLGRANLALSRSDEAEKHFEAQIALGQKMQDNDIIGSGYFNLAEVYMRRSAFDRAERLALKSLEMSNNHPAAKAANYRLLGDIYYKRGIYSVAETHFERAVDILRSRDDKGALARALIGLGFSKLRKRDRFSGCNQLREAQKLLIETNCTRGIAEIERNLNQTRC